MLRSDVNGQRHATPTVTGRSEGGPTADFTHPRAQRAYLSYVRALGIALPSGLNRMEKARREIVKLGKVR